MLRKLMMKVYLFCCCFAIKRLSMCLKFCLILVYFLVIASSREVAERCLRFLLILEEWDAIWPREYLLLDFPIVNCFHNLDLNHLNRKNSKYVFYNLHHKYACSIFITSSIASSISYKLLSFLHFTMNIKIDDNEILKHVSVCIMTGPQF